MIKEGAWLERAWSFDLPVSAFPSVLERLRGTAARMTELIAGATDDQLRAHESEAWSAKRHLGHLDDLHALDEHRLHEYLSSAALLTPADPRNRLTHETDHDAMPAGAIVARFRTHRAGLVTQMESLTEAQIASTALHPRLRRELRLIDWAYFVAEHDDHHLAAARQALTKSVFAKA